jgi:pyridoxal phosphate enzyme (YggS family)
MMETMTTITTNSTLADNFAAIHACIADACARSGRTASEVTLVAVSKTVDCEVVEQAAHLPDGLACHIFGENRAQELTRKLEGCPDQTFHFIGTLQRNKVRDIVGRVALVHSVDSKRLLDAISAQAQSRKITQKVLLQVNVSGEESKHGIDSADVAQVLSYAKTLEGVEVVGLMTMAPFGNPGDSRHYFRELKALADTHHLPELSMGMSNDFEVAIEEGATLIRVGSLLFG